MGAGLPRRPSQGAMYSDWWLSSEGTTAIRVRVRFGFRLVQGLWDAILYTSTLCSCINCRKLDRRLEVSTASMSTVYLGEDIEKNLGPKRGRL